MLLLLETLIALAIAATSVFGGLLAEDIVTKDGSCSPHGVTDLWSDACTSPSRIWWTVVSLVVLLAAMGVRSWYKEHNGTLYYLRLLPAEEADTLRAAADVANARSLDFRTATGWFGTARPVVDLRSEVDHVSDELERSMNDDDDATGYVIAPNLAFPAALAVGYDCLLRQRTHLAELPEHARTRRLPGGDTGVRTVWFDDGDDTWAEKRFRSRRAVTDRVLTLHTVGGAPADPLAVRRVWLAIRLDGGTTVGAVDADVPLRRTCEVTVVVGVVDGEGSDAGSGTGEAGENDDAALRAWEPPTGGWIPGRSGRSIDRRAYARMVEELSGAIEQVLDDYPEAEVFLSGRMPKSMAFALGFVISQRKDERIEGKRTRHVARADDSRAEREQAAAESAGLSSLSRFWTDVVPVLEHRGEFRPALVHSAQREEEVRALVDDDRPTGDR